MRIWWYVLSRARAFQSFTTYKQQFYRTKTKLRKDIFNKAYTKQNHIKQNRPRLYKTNVGRDYLTLWSWYLPLFHFVLNLRTGLF